MMRSAAQCIGECDELHFIEMRVTFLEEVSGCASFLVRTACFHSFNDYSRRVPIGLLASSICPSTEGMIMMW